MASSWHWHDTDVALTKHTAAAAAAANAAHSSIAVALGTNGWMGIGMALTWHRHATDMAPRHGNNMSVTRLWHFTDTSLNRHDIATPWPALTRHRHSTNIALTWH